MYAYFRGLLKYGYYKFSLEILEYYDPENRHTRKTYLKIKSYQSKNIYLEVLDL